MIDNYELISLTLSIWKNSYIFVIIINKRREKCAKVFRKALSLRSGMAPPPAQVCSVQRQSVSYSRLSETLEAPF